MVNAASPLLVSMVSVASVYSFALSLLMMSVTPSLTPPFFCTLLLMAIVESVNDPMCVSRAKEGLVDA